MHAGCIITTVVMHRHRRAQAEIMVMESATKNKKSTIILINHE
jgi:hypothetical protein